MMGTSVLYSSGDNGVAGNGGVCLDGPAGLSILYNLYSSNLFCLF